MPGMSSPQTRDYGAEGAAGWQAATYASHGSLPGSCVSGGPRKQGYVDAQVNGGAYMSPMSHGDGSQGVHSAAPGTEPAQETAEFAGGASWQDR